VEVSSLKNAFRTRGNPEILSLHMSEEEVVDEWIECVDTFIFVTRGSHNVTSVTRKEFLEL